MSWHCIYKCHYISLNPLASCVIDKVMGPCMQHQKFVISWGLIDNVAP